MKKNYLLLFAILTSSYIFGQNIAVNGGFENWSGGALNGGWTTVDFNTTDLTQNTNSAYITEGNSSVSVFLQTSNQADTDMLQAVNVVAGVTYTISLDVYATDNQARARLFGPSYSPSVYSDDTILNTWQTLTIQYTPTTSGTVTIGIRFYDTAANWTGNGSQFYIDNFQIMNPSTTPTLTLNDGPTNGDVVTGDPETINNAEIDFITTNFNVGQPGTATQGDGYIVWSVENTNGNTFVDGGNIYTSNDPLTVYPVNGLFGGQTYFFEAELVDNTGASLSSPVVYSFTMTIATYIDVPNLAALRAQVVSSDIFYRVTGEVYNTYSRASNNQKYFQDATGGILVHDPEFIITTVYNEGDGLTNMRGSLQLYNGLLELVPTYNDNWGKSSIGNIITPDIVTLNDVANNLNTYESKLVKINNVTFSDGNGVNVFAQSTNYTINDGTASTFRTNFSEANYINQTIPTGSTNMLAIVGNFNGAEQFTARSLAELTLSVNTNQIQNFNVYPNPTTLGYVSISSNSSSDMNIIIYDMLGKQVLQNTLNNGNLDVASLNSGVYIIKISQDSYSITKKLVIQ